MFDLSLLLSPLLYSYILSLYSLSLHLSSNESPNNEVWKTVVAGQVTCVSGSGSGSGKEGREGISSSSGSGHGGMGMGHGGHDASTSICAVGCSDGSLHLFSLVSGTRLMPPIVMGLAVAFLQVKTRKILAMTVDGEVFSLFAFFFFRLFVFDNFLFSVSPYLS